MVIDIARDPYIHRNSKSRCWSCGTPIDDTAFVQFRGYDSDINTHADCAARLGLHLAKDALLADQTNRGALGYPARPHAHA